MMSLSINDEIYGHRCLCGINSHTAAFVIGLVFMFCDLLDLMTSVYSWPLSSEKFAWAKVTTLIVDLLAIISAVALLHGNRAKIPEFYLPFMFIQLLEIVMFISLTVCHLYTLAIFTISPTQPDWITSNRITLASWSLACALLAFSHFFYGILLVLLSYTLLFEPTHPRMSPRSTQSPVLI
ncbi:hypothetical protein M3Y94_00093500 [Aphelenchoides besseyi]|nr:hypothetical protein M3Y94_00093500 [Aphelenchoides besseyi]